MQDEALTSVSRAAAAADEEREKRARESVAKREQAAAAKRVADEANRQAAAAAVDAQVRRPARQQPAQAVRHGDERHEDILVARPGALFQ